MYSEGHKHVTDVKLDSTVLFLNRILLLQPLLLLEELLILTLDLRQSTCTIQLAMQLAMVKLK